MFGLPCCLLLARGLWPTSRGAAQEQNKHVGHVPMLNMHCKKSLQKGGAVLEPSNLCVADAGHLFLALQRSGGNVKVYVGDCGRSDKGLTCFFVGCASSLPRPLNEHCTVNERSCLYNYNRPHRRENIGAGQPWRTRAMMVRRQHLVESLLEKCKQAAI